jgi:molybdopterin-binding protein
MSAYLRIGEVASAVGVSIDTLRRWEVQGRVTFERLNGQRVLAVSDLSALQASLSAQSTTSSARNRLPGVVVSVARSGFIAKVELACGDHRIVSLISREAADELALRPGANVTAVVQSMDVVIEIATPMKA